MLNDYAEAATVAGKVVVVGGAYEASPANTQYWVRAHDARTGEFLWDDLRVGACGQCRLEALASRGRLVFAAGTALGLIDSDFFVRTYDARTGAIVWENLHDQSGNDGAVDVAVAGRHVFVVGRSGEDFLVRAYDARPGLLGRLLWSQPSDFGTVDRPTAIAARGSRVYAVGAGGPAMWDAVIVARRAKDGAPPWDEQFDHALSLAMFVDVTVARGAVVAAGWVTNALGDHDFLLRAYADADSEDELWTFYGDLDGEEDQAAAVTSKGSRVYAAGYVTDAQGNTDIYVAAFHATTGADLWARRFDLAGEDDRAYSVAVVGNIVLVGGAGVRAQQTTGDLVLLAYDAKTGDLLWHVAYDRAGLDDYASAVAGKGWRAFVAGAVTELLGGENLHLRAHELR
jgi:hypothetical protein